MSYRVVKYWFSISSIIIPIGISFFSFLVLNLVLPRYIGAEIFSKFRTLLIFIGLSGIVHLGISDGMFYFFSSIGRIAINRFKLVLLSLILILNSILLSILVEIYFKFSVNFIILYLSILSVGFSTIFVQAGAIGLTIPKYSIFVVLQPIFSALFCLFGFYIHANATIFMALYSFGFLSQIFAFFLFKPSYYLLERNEFSLRSFFGAKYNGFYSLIGEIAFIIFLNIDKLILFHLLSHRDFGAYSIAFVAISAFRAIFGSVINLVIAKNLVNNRVYVLSVFSFSMLIAIMAYIFRNNINMLFDFLFPIYNSYNYNVFLYGTSLMSVIFLIFIPLIRRFETSSYLYINLFSSMVIIVFYFIENNAVNFDIAIRIYMIGLIAWIMISSYIIISKKTLIKMKSAS